MEDDDQKIEKESSDSDGDTISETYEDTYNSSSHSQQQVKLRKYKYVGTFDCNGIRNGFGRAFFINGDLYEGEYRQGLRHGSGKYTFKKGGVYDGSWLNGMKHGRGTFNYCDSTNYIGEFYEDKRQGYGKYEYSNNDVYEGYWFNHKRHGYGAYIYFQAGIKFEGIWKEGCRTSDGSLTLLDGSPVPGLSPGCIKVPIMVENSPDEINIRCEYLPNQDAERELMTRQEKIVQQLVSPKISAIFNNDQNFQNSENTKISQSVETNKND